MEFASLEHNGRLFRGIEEQAYVYFAHSYYLKAAEEEGGVKASTEYGVYIHATEMEKKIKRVCLSEPFGQERRMWDCGS